MSSRDTVPAGLQYTKTVFKVTLCSEFYVWKVVLVYFAAIGAFFVRLPLQLLRFTKSPESKHELAVLLSFVIAYASVSMVGLDLGWGTRLIAEHGVWKVWSVYTTLMIGLRFLVKVNRFTHQMIRGAVRSNASIALPTVCHAISNVLSYWCINAIIGTYLGGLYRRTPIFVAVCWHVQGALAEAFFPSVVGGCPGEREALSRVFMLVTIMWHATYGNIADITLQPILEMLYALARYFIVSMSDDANKFFAAVVTDGELGKPSDFANSIIVRFPIEGFSMCILSIILAGPVPQSAAVVAAIVVLGITSTFILHK